MSAHGEQTIGEGSAQLQQGATAVLEMPVPQDNHWEQQQQGTGASWSLEDKLCVLPEGGAQEMTQALWKSQKDGKLIPDLAYGVIYTDGI